MTDLEKSLRTAELVWSNPHFTSGRSQVSAHELDGELWVGFEATDHWTDILDHLLFIPVKFNGYWVHWGWLRAYRRVRSWVWEAVDQNLPVVFSGHSLGGAMAQIASIGLPGRVVTTGSPRPFFGKVPDKNCIRFKTKDDPIPTLPPFYKSTGFEVLLPGGKGWNDHLPGAYWNCI